MRQRIHMRIFIPVLLVVILLPLAIWSVFSVTSDWYSRYVAQKNIMSFMAKVEAEVAQVYRSANLSADVSREMEQEYSKQLLSQLKDIAKKESQDVNLMVLNSKMRQIYPNNDQEEQTVDVFYRQCKELLENGTLTEGVISELTLGKEEYLIGLYQVEAEHNIRAEYFIVFAPVLDMSLLLTNAGKLITMITALFLAAGTVLIWIVARGISGPLETLCRQTRLIGDGNYVQIPESYSIRELEQLKESFNTMSGRLQEAEEQNRRFFQNVSHDLRTPLVSITGYAQGIQCGVMKDQEKAAGIILTESLRMTNLVDSILMLSKLDNHEWKLNRVTIGLADFLEEQVEILQGITGEKELLLAETADGLAVDVDPDLLIRIFQNVISNGVRYAMHCVMVTMKQENSWAVIEVADDGPGIAGEELDHIFERFYHGKHGGFGIGLSVVWSGMEYLGGKVTVCNRAKPQQGAVYRLYLPML